MTGLPPGGQHARTVLSHAVMAATHYLEVRAGQRPIAHLETLVAPAVQRRIRGMLKRRRAAAGARTVTLRRVFADRQRGVVHVVVLLVEDGRLRPVAMGVDLAVDGPVITSIGLPEDHRPTTADPGGTARGVLARHVTTDNPHPELLAAPAPPPTILRGGRPAA